MIWNISPEILSVGPFHIRWYGLFFAVGFLIGYQMVSGMFRRDKLPTDKLDSLLVYMMLGTVIGARLGHCLVYEPEIYLHDPIRILKVWEGGLASHFGGAGTIAGVWLWSRKYFKKGSLLMLLDYVCIPTALVGAMIRLGNFFNSEILGKETQGPFGIIFSRVDNKSRHPAQLYESFSYLLAFGALLFIYKKGWYKGRVGLVFGVFLVMLFISRILIELVKEPQVSFEASLPMDLGQLLSFPYLALGFFLIYRGIQAGKLIPQPKPAKGKSK